MTFKTFSILVTFYIFHILCFENTLKLWQEEINIITKNCNVNTLVYFQSFLKHHHLVCLTLAGNALGKSTKEFQVCHGNQRPACLVTLVFSKYPTTPWPYRDNWKIVSNVCIINENMQHDGMGDSAWLADIGKYVIGIRGSLMRDAYSRNALVLMSKHQWMGLVIPNTGMESDQEYLYRNLIITIVVTVLTIITCI